MIGLIVQHAGNGLGKIAAVNNGHISVDFFFPAKRLTLVAVVNGVKVLRRSLLPLKAKCKTAEGACVILEQSPGSGLDPHIYLVEFENGLSRRVSETELEPSQPPRSATVLDALSSLEVEGYGSFQKREALADQWWHLVRLGLGVNALLSSRIDLRPHQAYVAGTVLLDRRQRYLLADEVGLGKTIEAGIVIHELLQQNPSANILVLCPDPLSQQWLCELYAKFSGKVFHMLELRGRGPLAGTTQAIAPFTVALRLASSLLQKKWDLVVIDEAHHLLGIPKLYQIAKGLSGAAPACLLLSALPASHREDEYLRLLALLEPARYRPEDPQEKERFKLLYGRQVEISRKLGYIARQLAISPEKAYSKCLELVAFPVLAADPVLGSMAKRLDQASTTFPDDVSSLLHYVGDRYRISRRILRNRRSQLVEAQPDLKIERKLRRIPSDPDQLELDARAAIRSFLSYLQQAGAPVEVMPPLARHLYQASADPACLLEFLQLASAPALGISDLLALDSQISYSGWQEYAAALWGSIVRLCASDEFRSCLRAAKKWTDSPEPPGRVQSLVNFLKPRHRQDPERKFLIFAGFPGLAARVADALAGDFSPASSVARFTSQMSPKAKEKEAHRFRRDQRCWLLVCDETGGEGRNFQFAHELIHYDLPWHVAKIEQRIGRLDRLGRTLPEVCSNVLFCPDEEDDGLLACLESGFQIFSRSISGLEFALRDIESQLVAAAISEGFAGLQTLAPAIAEKVATERDADLAQAVLDAASLERVAAEAFRKVQSTPDRDLGLERAFCEYFKFLAGSRSVRFLRVGDYPEGVVEFRPDQAQDLPLALPGTPDEPPADHVGTFRRAMAQDNPDFEFFSVGNPFFDAVCASLRDSPKARIYAVECRSARPQWRGFEFSYRPVGRHSLLSSYPGLIGHLRRIFAVRLEHCFIGENLQIASDGAALLDLRRSLKREDKDRTWWNFTLKNGRTTLLQDRYTAAGWAAMISKAERAARDAARERLSLALAAPFEAERARITEQIRQAEAAQGDDWQDEVAGLRQLLQAMAEWDLEMNIAGFLSVNGGLI